MAGERHMIRALCGLNKTFDKDVTIVLALNRISALIGIFFGNALPYVYFGCLSSIELREGGGGTLGISGWGCAAGTRDSSAEFCYPILE